MVFCTNCGTKNSESDNYCEKCGNKVPKNFDAVKIVKNVDKPKIKERSSKNSRSVILVTIAVSLLLGSSIGIGTGYYVLQPQIDSLKDDIVLLNEEKNEIEGQRIELSNVNSDLNFQILDLNSDLQELEKDIARKKNEIDSLGIRISEINAQKAKLESDVTVMRNQVQGLELDREKNKAEIAELNEDIRVNIQNIETLVTERNNLRADVSELKEELELWELWKKHRRVTPSNNIGYRYQGAVCSSKWICEIRWDSIVIPFNNVFECMEWINFMGTGSMNPFIGKDAQGVAIKADCLTESDISAGDMISFNADRVFEGMIGFEKGGPHVMHQVIEVVSCSHDSSKTCYITKGTNVDVIDGEIRFEEVSSKLILVNF
jgi:outer membrane murein-binding lipoprotein Lpp